MISPLRSFRVRDTATNNRGRPLRFTSYSKQVALFNTPSKKASMAAMLGLGLAFPFAFADHLVSLLALAFAAAIGAIGLNIVSGYAGQISLGHAFFLGLGAYTAAVLGGDPEGRTLGLGLPMGIWLPGAGLAAMVVGAMVAPLATRLRGLYLAMVTLGLVFLGLHIFRALPSVTGGVAVGRPSARAVILGYDFNTPGTLLGISVSAQQKQYFLSLSLLLLFAVLGRNLARSRYGRAFSAIRDQDIAAAHVGIDLALYKGWAFAISSFFAGVAGALFYGILGFIDPTSFNLLLSVQYIAMIFIGGIATISGSIMGAIFIITLGRITQLVSGYIPFLASSSGDGGLMSVFQLEAILYGLLIVGFVLFEPRGLFGIWIRVRNYFKSWPFSY